MKKQLTVFILLCFISVIGFTGCSGNNDNQGSPDDTQTPSLLSMAISSEPDSLDPMVSAASDTKAAILFNVYEGLLSFDESGSLLPSLATEYSISEDGLDYSFTLKEGVKFHNGQPFSAKDVKYTYDKLAGLSGGLALNETLSALIDNVEIIGDYNVTIHLKERNSSFLTQCIVPVCPENYENAAMAPIGTGPYKFKDYLPGQKVILERNVDYNTRADVTPTIDEIEVRIITDENARLLALKSGDLDLTQISANDKDAFKGGFQIYEVPGNSVQVIGLNNSVAPLNDLRVRQAINYAVNKEEIINGAFSGSGTRVDSFLSPVMKTYYNDNMTVYETDIEKSKALLKEAGYENGFTLTVTVPSNYQEHVDTAQILKNQLEKVGITVEIEIVEWAAWLENVYTNADYQATIITHTGKLDPNDFLNRFESSYPNNYFRFSNEEYDALIMEASLTTDETKRAEIYKKCQQLLVDCAASVFVHDMNVIYAVKNGVSGFKTYPVQFYNFAAMKI
ncbi:MAG: ABC transporter substrate-binding protein [Clostridiales bacterium]|jgi:peptide/nickel transport system substrate-binding protein|nr:ABC transporter substrate-binding protein [Clostridiales bacterium]